jgi:hypothetical protein
VIAALMTLVLLACLVVLGVQIMIIRQIGILHSRMLGSVGAPAAKPTRTTFRKLHYLDGRERLIADREFTAYLFLSSTCYTCRPMLEKITGATILKRISIALIAADDQAALNVAQQFNLPQSITLRGNELQSDLAVAEVPSLLVLDRFGNVLRRTFVDSVSMIERELAHVVPSSLKKLDDSLTEHSNASDRKEDVKHELVGRDV